MNLIVRGKEANDNYAVVDEETGGREFYEEFQTEARTERLVLCWNSHDDLLAACEAVVKDLECFDLDEPEAMGRGPCVVCQAKAAIAKSKR